MSETKTPPIGIIDLMIAPFVLGGRDPAVGLDCWGFVMAVRERLGLGAPDITGETVDICSAASRGCDALMKEWTPITVEAVAVGDVIVLPGPSGRRTHAGVYMGGRPALVAHFNENRGQQQPWSQVKRHAKEIWRAP